MRFSTRVSLCRLRTSTGHPNSSIIDFIDCSSIPFYYLLFSYEQ